MEEDRNSRKLRLIEGSKFFGVLRIPCIYELWVYKEPSAFGLYLVMEVNMFADLTALRVDADIKLAAKVDRLVYSNSSKSGIYFDPWGFDRYPYLTR